MAEREKSTLYPNATWKDCFDFVKTVDSFKLKSVAYLEVAKKYGLNSVTTKSFTSKISSSKQFGLITTNQSTIQLTDTCKRLLYPTGGAIRSIELACFSMPPLYNKLIASFDGKALPTESILGNILMTEYKIARAVKDVAARIFLESAEQLSLIQGGVLTYSESENVPLLSEEVETPLETNHMNASKEYETTTDVTNHTLSMENKYITQAIPMKSGNVAKIIIPIDSDEEELLMLRDMLNVILTRKFNLKLSD